MFFNECLVSCRTVLFTLTSVVVLVITTDWISWDKLNRGFLPSDEVSRAFLASFILVFDLLIVMQVGVFAFPSSHWSCSVLCSECNTHHTAKGSVKLEECVVHSCYQWGLLWSYFQQFYQGKPTGFSWEGHQKFLEWTLPGGPLETLQHGGVSCQGFRENKTKENKPQKTDPLSFSKWKAAEMRML